MRVRCQEQVDVNFIADVSFEDVLIELGERVDEGEEMPPRLVESLDMLTRILSRVEDKWIAAMTPAIRNEMFKRLSTQIERYRTS